uniref:Zinc transporter ZIP3 n=1 Tax=Caligus rogercresseyi TaxID=217165 RepID=C1BR80_CALRO|nr:Zinc transporter ZIP3 [Caligus rogercresseyi]|eukprot:TRINITY_DN15644_c0_g1_i1.p1 TRINITY_DN15644_c0_g1~~TRINITY_DN15644_c0_g1_i1.p1  ORF type:complete len:304 (+),score=51.46 TRINITY_DN15644_c0_g1_i1:15-926(+)
MEVLGIKIIILFTILFSSLFLGALPWKIVTRISPSRSSKTNVLLSIGNCFAGGVFLCVTFLHILPHVREDFGGLHLLGDYALLEHYPLAELIFMVGFFLVLFVEQLVLHYKDPEILDSSTIGEYQRAARVSEQEDDHLQRNDDGFHEDTTSLLRSIVLLVALSVHSVLEGLAIGLQSSERELWEILAAVLSHKLIMAFTFGLSVSQSKIRVRTFALFVFIFSFSCPLGIAIGSGIAAMPYSSVGNVIRVVLTGLSGGTFLFVTFFEIISKEFTRIGYGRLLKFLSLFIGFLGMSGLLVLHSHE